jgi:DNA gyrase subunit A
MSELGLAPNKAYKKSARTVGDVLGKYHPHGDTSVYEAMVGMAQDFKSRYPTVNGHGNFGSIDGDPAAAMRYTESKMSNYGAKMVEGIDESIVDFVPNFDESMMEPSVLPTFFPNLLCNGTSGIAVGMATSIPPHHAGSIYNALKYAIKSELEDEEISLDELIKIVVAPDFPTGGIITNLSDVHKGYRTGRGRVQMRSRFEIEESKKMQSIVITEVPFKVNKSTLVTQIDNLRKDELKEEIREVRDESAREGIRVVVDLKRDANVDFVIKRLLKSTDMQSSFSMNMIALQGGRPVQFNLKDAIEAFLVHVAEIITRRTERDLIKARRRLHIVDGIISILDIIDEVIAVIKAAKSNPEVIEGLMTNFDLSEEQARAIAEMRLRSLSQASISAYQEEKETLESDIARFTDILTNTETLLNTMYTEVEEVEKTFEDKRRTEIRILENISADDRELIKEEDLIVTISENGLIKSVIADSYQAKGRGTKGTKSSVKDDDRIAHMFAVNSRDDLLFFTNTGRCHLLEVYKLPVQNKTQNGKYMANYLNLESNEYVVSVIPKQYDNNEDDILMATRLGTIKRLELSSLSSRMKQTRVITFKENDELVAVQLMYEQDIVLFTAQGQGLRFNPDSDGKGVRPMGRTAAGVKGIRLKGDDYVIAMTTVVADHDLLLATVKGFGKRVDFSDFPVYSRAGQGVRAINLTDKTGLLQCAVQITDENDLLIATTSGIMSRIHADTIRTMGRSAAGVKLIGLTDQDEVISVSRHEREEEEELEPVE